MELFVLFTSCFVWPIIKTLQTVIKVIHFMLFCNSVSATFKTIPVTAVTTVTDVIQIALEKFGLEVCILILI